MRTIQEIKARRFSTTARILTGQPLEAKIVDDASQSPAWTDCHTTIFMNEARPKANSDREALVYDRGKLFHEIDHCEFHGKRIFDYYNKLAKSKAKDAQSFLNIGNALLDGHGEFHGGRKWQGQTAYIMATLHALVDVNNPSVFSGLLLFVRIKKWRNAKEAAYWQPYEARILEAITCRSAVRTLDIALEIADALSDAKPKQPEYKPEGKPEKSEESEEGEEGNDSEPPDVDESEEESDDCSGTPPNAPMDSKEKQDESKEEECDNESNEEEKRDTEASSDSDEASGEESESEDEGESDEESEEESEDDEGSDQSGNGESESGKLIDSDVEREIQEAVQNALDDCETESAKELQDILSEFADQEPEQQYLPNEEPIASELSEVLRSVLIERNRTVWTPSKRSGRLNTHRLTNVVTGGTFLQHRNRVEGTPKVALLLDCSSSIEDMQYDIPLSAAARVLNGALWLAGIDSLTLTFRGEPNDEKQKQGIYQIDPIIEKHRFLPPTTLHCFGSTPTDAAMETALAWLEGASKSLMVIVTDGQPDSAKKVEEQYARAVCANCYVVLVTIGTLPTKGEKVCDEKHVITNVSDLPRVLEPTLATFARR